MTSFPTSRDDAPAYLSRYQSRRSTTEGPVDYHDGNEPPYLARARQRSIERAVLERATEGMPPGRTEAYAASTSTPRELDVAPSVRKRLQGSTDVRLIRHGQTQGYATDAALTPMGRWQAHRKGQDLARGITEGVSVRLLHAPTARARETAQGVREGLLQACARYGIAVDGAGAATIGALEVAPLFDNFQVWCDGKEMDVTAAFFHFATELDGVERSGAGDRPGWMVEMDRFWKVEAGGGDPITHWLNHPMQYFEPAALVVRRFWQGITRAIAEGPDNQRIFVCSHSGPIRAVATHAVGHDPGEPYNLEDVRIRVLADREHALVTYRGRGVEIEVPTTVVPSWYAPTPA